MSSPGVRLTGVDDDGRSRFSVALAHGMDPDVAAYEHGFSLVRPLDAVRAGDGALELRLLVRPAERRNPPRSVRRGQDPNLVLAPGERPVTRQRIACYAIVTSELGLLATEFSAKTAVPGRWGLPGGGLDLDEDPRAAVLREIAEESDQIVVLGDLVRLQTQHWIGRSPRGVVEDYHAVRLIYRASCPRPTTPQVLDTGGTTESARWIALADWRSLPWTRGWRDLLRQELPDRPC